MRARTWKQVQRALCGLIMGVATCAPRALADTPDSLARSRPAPGDSLPGVAGPDTTGMASLAATTAPPWVPAHAVPARAGWETAVQLPMRIVSLPLTELGLIAKRTMVSVEDANWIPRVAYLITAAPRVGVFLIPASLGDRTGFGLGIAVVPPGLRNYLGADWNGSTLDYNRTRVTARYGVARVDYIYEWRPQDRFYGLGPASSIDAPPPMPRRASDRRWGARIVAGFTDAHIRAAVAMGHYSDPCAAAYIVQTLIDRRDKIVHEILPERSTPVAAR
jgi:hypothetical protein